MLYNPNKNSHIKFLSMSAWLKDEKISPFPFPLSTSFLQCSVFAPPEFWCWRMSKMFVILTTQGFLASMLSIRQKGVSRFLISTDRLKFCRARWELDLSSSHCPGNTMWHLSAFERQHWCYGIVFSGRANWPFSLRFEENDVKYFLIHYAVNPGLTLGYSTVTHLLLQIQFYSTTPCFSVLSILFIFYKSFVFGDKIQEDSCISRS